MTFYRGIDLTWDVWMAWRLIASVWSDRAGKRPAFAAGALHWTITAFGLALVVAVWSKAGWLTAPVWFDGPVFGWTMVALTVAGFACAWWTRLYLGPFWSASVGRKADHQVIEAGPYALARHPI